ncbi:MAG: UDP-glucose/GDP-mannose dehydrogenase family protein [Bacteroidetes bacterium]|nr:UDP-glucose/GDP-mannose dehydrogenase family protein [Bacteroidota bacterium]
MKIGVVGTGYVGLVTGTCFAEMGFDVTCVDIDEKKIELLQSGTSTIYEEGLDQLLRRNLRDHRLSFTTDLQDAAQHSLVLFLALPTPPGEDGSADLSFVETVIRDLGSIWSESADKSYHVVVNKSTVTVGTADRVSEILQDFGLVAGEDFDVVSNPEFLREGVAVLDFMKPERVIIGTESERAAEIMKSLYEPFVRQGNPIVVMDARSAELTKYAANSFLATKISFINEVANLCEKLGANVDQVRHGMGLDSRIGNLFLYPGIGFGGSCFPKDVQALRNTATKNGYTFKILDAVLEVNDIQRNLLASRIIERFGGSLSGKKIAIWGLSFKAQTDDVRESPAHSVINGLLEAGAEIFAFDPEAIETTRAVFGDKLNYGSDPYDVLTDADALAVCTEWHEFRRPDYDRVRELMKNPLVFDGRNLFRPEKMKQFGWEYYSIGRPSSE